MDTVTRNALPLRHTAWRSAVEHRSLAVLLGAALPVEIAAAANLVLRVSSVDSTGRGALGVGGAFAAMSLAFAITVIPAGVLVDRTPARRTFAVALALRALPMLIGGVLALNGGLTTAAVVVLAAADGLTMALLRPSWQHFQASLVSATAVRDAAILDDWIARAGALLGAVGGGLCAAVGLTGVGLAACATGFVPLLAALALGLGSGLRRPTPGVGPVQTLRDAWSMLRTIPRLREATRADILLQLAMPTGVLASAVAVALSAVAYLWLIALAAGLGALIGTSWVTWAWNRECPAGLLRRSVGLLVAVLVVDAAALASQALAPTPVWLGAACVAVAVGAAAMTSMFAVTGSIVQAEAPAHVRGGVTGLAQAPKHAAMFASALAVGAVMTWAGPALAVGMVAAGLVLAVVLLRGFRSLRAAS
ncbi:MFS transporter [Mycolicibacterium sp. CR10]|uniref:MFS transporter n=1 Tax=Mycolicibacterium sp. CR10 TaxID=2562314 RepID=UPI0010BF8E7D|nr:MFS transporter [Mycolicibacterium sp. CR10]